jgi:hypothetical protein
LDKKTKVNEERSASPFMICSIHSLTVLERKLQKRIGVAVEFIQMKPAIGFSLDYKLTIHHNLHSSVKQKINPTFIFTSKNLSK